MLRVRVTARLGGNSRIKPVPADNAMTQPGGVRDDGTLVTYAPKLKIEPEGNAPVFKTVKYDSKEVQ